MSRATTARFALILGALSSFGPLSIDMYLPAFPAMAGELRTGPFEIQLNLTACTIGLALGQLIAGPMSDTLGRRRPLLVGVAVFTITSLLCAITPSAAMLVVLRLVQGLGGAAGIVIARAVVRDLYSGVALARFFSLLLLVNGLAPVIAPVLGGQVLHWVSWRGVFVVLGAIGLVLLIGAALGLPETLPVARRRPGSLRVNLRTFRDLLRDRFFLGYALACALAFASMFTYISDSSFVLQDLFGLSPQGFSLVFGLNSLGIMAVGQLNSWLVSRVTPRRLLLVGLVITVSGGLVLLVAALTGVGLIGVLPGLFLVASSIGMVFPNATALAMADHPTTAGNASALLGVLQFFVGGITAPLAGASGAVSTVSMAVVMAVLAVGALVVFLVLTRGKVTPESTPTPATDHQLAQG
jgi:MFS transporter, DHA1 family, multidrug resistance protein